MSDNRTSLYLYADGGYQNFKITAFFTVVAKSRYDDVLRTMSSFGSIFKDKGYGWHNFMKKSEIEQTDKFLEGDSITIKAEVCPFYEKYYFDF